jgi:ferredoxin-NADP reductase
MTAQPVRVGRVEELTPGVRRFTLVPERGALPAFSGGSHIGVMLPDAGAARRNSYSLTSSPYERSFFQIAVKREPASRGGSAYLHESVREGSRLEIAAPVNQFPLANTGRHHLLIAGGIGITPFLSQIESLQRWGHSFELHDCYRGAENAPFLGELRERLGPRFHGYDTSRGARPDLVALLRAQVTGAHVYVCGPAGLIDAVVAAARTLGWPRHHVHFERFSAGPQAPTRPFVARLARSGQDVSVSDGSSLLDALDAAGHAVPYSCRIGGCGTCEVAVIEGEVDHRDHCWTDEDRAGDRRILACISRAKNGHLVLDL